MNIFKTEDFLFDETSMCGHINPRDAARLANHKLEKEATIVYKEPGEWGYILGNGPGIYILKDENCKHPKEKVNRYAFVPCGETLNDGHEKFYKCECGKNVIPSTYEEIKCK